MFLGFVGARLLSRSGRRRETYVYYASPPPGAPKEKPKEASEGILDTISQEVGDLKKIGIGMAMGVMREVAANAVPPIVGPAVSEAMNSLTVRLGGQPLSAPQPGQTTTIRPTPHHEEGGTCGSVE